MKMNILSMVRVFVLVSAILAGAVVVGSAQTADTADPKLLDRVDFVMPQSAIDAGLDGQVLIGAKIDEKGNVTEVKLAGGPMWSCDEKRPKQAIKDLAAALEAIVGKARFSPAIADGKAVAKEIEMMIRLKNPKFQTKVPVAQIGRLPYQPGVNDASSGILVGKVLRLPKPELPSLARRERLGGVVLVAVYVDEKGKVIRAGAIRGADLLRDPARDAACGARFAPTKLHGQTIPLTGVINYAFVF